MQASSFVEASPLRRSVQFDEAPDTSDEEPVLSSAAQDALKALSFQEAEGENGGSEGLFQEIWGLSQVRLVSAVRAPQYPRQADYLSSSLAAYWQPEQLNKS